MLWNVLISLLTCINLISSTVARDQSEVLAPLCVCFSCYVCYLFTFQNLFSLTTVLIETK